MKNKPFCFKLLWLLVSTEAKRDGACINDAIHIFTVQSDPSIHRHTVNSDQGLFYHMGESFQDQSGIQGLTF